VAALSLETRAKLACAYSGVVWGVFWMPLRFVEDAGIAGAWSSVLFFLIPSLLLMPYQLVFRLGAVLNGGRRMQVTAIFAALSLGSYALSVLYTEVIRAMLLFYLTPLWSTLLARAVLGEPITRIRWIAMGLAFAGMLVIFGADVGMPWPRNVGDWLGLASGLLWAVTAVRLRSDRANHPADITAWYLFYALVLSLVFALADSSNTSPPPDPAVAVSTLGWLVPVLLVVMVPGAMAAMWGPKYLDPGIVGLLFMTEIIVGTATIAVWAGEPFGLREIAGIVLIAGGAVLESVVEFWRSRPSAAAG
jgi:drug/metabolite transporter (DMT)-like permease